MDFWSCIMSWPFGTVKMDGTEPSFSKEIFMTKKSLRKGILAIVLSTVMAAMSACGGTAGTAEKTMQAADISDSVTAGATENGAGTDAANASGTDSANPSGTDGTSAAAGAAPVNLRYTPITSDLTTFKSGDIYQRWTAGQSVMVKADGESVEISGKAPGIACEGTDISITSAGTYIFEGNLNGTITVNAGEKAKVRLILNGFEITSSDGPAIRILENDRVTISLEDGTENVVTDSETYSDETFSAALFSKADLIFNGTGKLKVNGNHSDAIASKDDLRIVSGTYVINAVDDGLVGKDRLKIKDGTFSITSGGDALKTTNTEKADRGFVYIANGTFKLTSGDESIDAATSIRIDDGDFTILTGDGSSNAVRTSSEQGFGAQGGPGGMEFGHGGFPGGMPGEKPSDFRGEMPDDSDHPFWQESGRDERGFGGRGSEEAGTLSGSTDENSVGTDSAVPTKMSADQIKGDSNADAAFVTYKTSESADSLIYTTTQNAEEMAGSAVDDIMNTTAEAGNSVTFTTIQNAKEMTGNAVSGGFMKLASEESQTDDTSGLSEEEAAAAAAMADEYDDTDTADTIATAKGIKCEGVLEIRGGTFAIDTEDDALNGGYQVIISGGTLTIKAGDDGIHADDKIDISGGEITIENSYEGLEAVNINISGGNTSVTASDDGVNAAGGSISSTTSAGANGSDKSSGDGASNSSEAGAAGNDNTASGAASGTEDAGATGDNKTVDGAASGTEDADTNGNDNIASGADSGTEDAGATGNDRPAGGPDMSGEEAGPHGAPPMSGDGTDVAGNESVPSGDPNGMRGMGGMGGMFEESSGYLTITGGKLYVNSGGDGLDANTDIKQTGGEVIVEGPTDNGNGSLDYGNSYKMSGGTLTATGSSGMLQSISEDSKSYAVTVLFSDNVAVGTTISLRTSSGKKIASLETTKVTETFQFAGDGLKKGGTYKLYCDDEEICTITLTGKVTTVDDSGAETSVSGMMMGRGHVRS